MFLRAFLLLLLFLTISGCANVPSIREDIARAESQKDKTDPLSLLRQQDEIITGRKFIDGNSVILLRNGAEAYPAMLQSIRHAKHRIDMESFMFDEEEGSVFAEELLERSADGVEVNLIYDSYGSDDTPSELFDHMREGGIHVVEYNPVDPGSIFNSKFNHRDHRKLLLIDGRTAFVGGINISALYNFKLGHKRFGYVKSDDLDPDHSPWRDTQVKIVGPAVAQFEHLFVQTWHEQEGQPTIDVPSTPATHAGNISLMAIDGTPDLDRFAIYRSLLVAIALAQHSIHITTAYFVPTPALVHALERAAARGVDITLIVPSQSDSDLALKAGRAYYEDLLEAGVHIYELQSAILHAKTVVIDGQWSSVGSSNLDWRSVLFNNECNAVILGDAFGKKMESMFQNDVAQSKAVNFQHWSERSIWEILDEWKARAVEYFL